MRNTYNCKIHLDSYISHPFWPETSDAIDVQKKSGINRCRTEATRDNALKSYLKKEGLTMEDYELMLKKSKRQWYRVDNDDEDSPIIIPRHHLAGCLVQTVGTCPATIRGKFKRDSFRHHVRLSDFTTEKTKADGVFDRYVKLETTNQRNRQRNEYIENFEAVGTIEIVNTVKLDVFRHLLEYALNETGLGASRKMGYGRGVIVELG